MSRTILKTGADIYVQDMQTRFHGDFHIVGDCLIAYVAREGKLEDLSQFDAGIFCVTERDATIFYRATDPYAIIVVAQEQCKLSDEAMVHIRTWHPDVTLEFANFQQDRFLLR